MTWEQPRVPSLQERRHADRIEWDEQAAFRNALGRQLLQGPLEMSFAHLSGQSLLEGTHHVAHV